MPSNHPLDFDPDALTDKFTGAEEESDSLPEAPSPTAADGDDYGAGPGELAGRAGRRRRARRRATAALGAVAAAGQEAPRRLDPQRLAQ